VFADVLHHEQGKHGKCEHWQQDMEDVVEGQDVQLIERNLAGFAEHRQRRQDAHQNWDAPRCTLTLHVRSPECTGDAGLNNYA